MYLQPQYSWQHETGGAAGRLNLVDFDIHQGFLEARKGAYRWCLGRQELAYGDGRLVGNSDWNNIARSFDAAKVSVADKRASSDFFIAKLGLAANKATDPILTGIYTTIKVSTSTMEDIYLLYKTVRLSPSTRQDVFTFGTRPSARFARYADATLEGAFQIGQSASRALQAAAFAGVVGYTAPIRWSPRIGVEFDYATGGDPSGTGTSRTFDQLYPSNHPFYGLMDYVGWRNMRDWRISFRANPAKRLTCTLDEHSFSLVDGRDFWYNAAGQPNVGISGHPLRDPSGASGTDLGTELDVSAAYQATPTINVSTGYGRFRPGRFQRLTNAGHADPADWFYAQTRFSF